MQIEHTDVIKRKMQKAIKKRILELLKERNMTKYRLSKITEMNPSTLTTILHRKNSLPMFDTLYIICCGLGIELTEFFDSEMFTIKK